MDKRTLIFIFSMTVALLAINTFFSYWNRQSVDEWTKQQTAKKEKLRQELQQTIEQNTVAIQNLPIVSVEDKGKNFYGYGVKTDDSLILIKWKDKVPEEVIAQDVEYTLAGRPNLPDSPAIYSSKSGSLVTKTLPNFGSYNLQLVFLPREKDKQPQSALAEYRNTHLSLPIETLAKEFPDEYKNRAPNGIAVALLKSEGKYIPVGIYTTGQQLLVPLSDFSYLASSLQQIKPKEDYANTNGKERFYVLENDYQQLVFSNKGGALSEINLPFQNFQESKKRRQRNRF